MESVGFEINAATWFYLSFLLIVSVFFRFGRTWSLRNADLALLLAMSPGFVLMKQGQFLGDVWLFAAAGLMLVRVSCDWLLTRRPLLETNLNPSGMGFLGISAFAFLMTIVATSPPPQSTVDTVRRADKLLHRKDTLALQNSAESGPASSLLAAPVVPITNAVVTNAVAGSPEETPPDQGLVEIVAARIMVFLAHGAVIAALLFAARLHFGDPSSGIAMATLYLLLPCTAYDVGKLNHVLPAALVAWAFVAYRRPMVAGSLLGLACGTVFFPVFLLPLWAAFYGRRGAMRFGLALSFVAAVLLGTLALTSADRYSFTQQTIGSIEWTLLEFRDADPSGFWSLYDPAYRIPLFAAFAVMVVVLTIWPRTKSPEHLLSHSTAILIGTQFWYPQKGGVYVLWYLPMVLMVVFRPRLNHLGPPQLAVAKATAGLETRPSQAAPSVDVAAREPALSGSGSRPLFR